MAEIPWMNEDGSFTDDWLEKQSPEFHSEGALKDIKGMPGLLKSWIDTKKSLGGRVPLPEEGKEAEFFRKHFQAPEQPGDYGLNQPSDWPQDVPFDKGLVERFAQAAAEAGMPKTMAQKVYEKVIAGERTTLTDALKKRQEADSKAETQSLALLKDKWGEEDEKFKPKLELALRGFRHEAIPDVLRARVAQLLKVESAEKLTDEQIGSFLRKNAPLAMVCANIGALTADTRRVTGQPAGGSEEEEEQPPSPKSPELYRSYGSGHPKHKFRQWFEARGYDYETGTWTRQG